MSIHVTSTKVALSRRGLLVLAGACAPGLLAQNKKHIPVGFQLEDGVKPIDILAKSADLTFHIDVNVCRRAGSDLVAFMKQYPTKTDCLLLTDATPDADRHPPAPGKGDTNWKGVFATTESVGGVKYYLLTDGAMELTPLETVKRDLEQYKSIHG